MEVVILLSPPYPSPPPSQKPKPPLPPPLISPPTPLSTPSIPPTIKPPTHPFPSQDRASQTHQHTSSHSSPISPISQTKESKNELNQLMTKTRGFSAGSKDRTLKTSKEEEFWQKGGGGVNKIVSTKALSGNESIRFNHTRMLFEILVEIYLIR